MNFSFLFARRNSSDLENRVNLKNLKEKALRQPDRNDIAIFDNWLHVLDCGESQMVYRAGIMLNWLIRYYGARGFDTTVFYEMYNSKLSYVSSK